jgi:hypothetical protein
MKSLSVFLGVLCGAYVGLVFGFLGAMGLGLAFKWADPTDPSAGSIAILVIVTAPYGAIIGAVLGGLLVAKRPRLFLVTVLPLAVLFLGFQVATSALRSHDVPRTYVVKVTGKQGADFIGEVRTDGELHKLKGKLPAEFEYQALEVEFAFALPSAKEGEKIGFEILIDGKPKRGWSGKGEGEKRVAAKYRSFGYSESFGWFGGTSYWGGCDLLPEHRPAPQE